MAKKGGAKKAPKKEAKQKVKKPGKKLGELYTVSGDKIERKNRSCPKCGKGIFMGKHKDRWVCGKCKYVEYLGK